MSIELLTKDTTVEQADPIDEGDVDTSPAPVARGSSPGRLLLVLLLVAGGACAWFLLYGGPRHVSAADSLSAIANDSAVSDFLGGGNDLAKMKRSLQHTKAIVHQFMVYPTKTQIPLSELRTNPFRQGTLPSQAAVSSESISHKRQEEERTSMLKAVGDLQLQSVLHGGSHRSCMINNTLYQEGQQVSGFTVEQINTQSVVLRHGTYRFELRMDR